MSKLTDPKISFEDPLTLLPRRPIQQYPRKRVLYDPQRPSDSLFVVVSGRVKVTHAVTDGSQTIMRIVTADGIFGESSLLGVPSRHESAIALENVKAMSWTAAEIEHQIQREPRLGVALVQYMVRQCLQMEERIQCMAICKTPERVALALVQLADMTGIPLDEGIVRMGGLTHQTLAEYIGTSREIVTFQLNRLRRVGMVKYTRKTIDVNRRGILAGLRQRHTPVPALSERAESATAVR